MQDLISAGFPPYAPTQPEADHQPEELDHPYAGWYRGTRKVTEVMAYCSGTTTLHLIVRGFSLVTGYSPLVVVVVSGVAAGGLWVASRWAETAGQKSRLFWLGTAIATGSLLAWWDHLQLLATTSSPEARFGVFLVFGLGGWVVFQLWRQNRIYKAKQQQAEQPYYGGFTYDPHQ